VRTSVASLFGLRGGFRLLQTEMVLTKTMMAMSIMTPFFYSIGMSQAQIGFSQALFTIALLLLNIPTGWLADKFSRRWCNLSGDIMVAASLLYYSQANSFTDVVMAEIGFGVGVALSQGSDSGLQKAFCRLLAHGSLERESQLLLKSNSRTNSLQFALQMILVFIGGIIGSEDMRLVIALSAIPYVIGALCMMLMREVGERRASKHRNPLRDIAEAVREIANHRELRTRIAAYAVGRELTHVMVWGATPIMLVAGVTPSLVGLGWALNSVAAICGSILAQRYSPCLPEWVQFGSLCLLVLTALSVMIIHLSLATIWLYMAMGLGQGWSGVTLRSMLQRHSPLDKVSIIDSTAGTGAQLLYIPLVIGIGIVGAVDIRLSLVAIVAVFVPLAIVISLGLRRSILRN
jgi:MFS family permease